MHLFTAIALQADQNKLLTQIFLESEAVLC
jgi:hypothetical protein